MVATATFFIAVLGFRPFRFHFHAGGPGSGRNPEVAIPPAAEDIPPPAILPTCPCRSSEREVLKAENADLKARLKALERAIGSYAFTKAQ